MFGYAKRTEKSGLNGFGLFHPISFNLLKWLQTLIELRNVPLSVMARRVCWKLIELAQILAQCENIPKHSAACHYIRLIGDSIWIVGNESQRVPECRNSVSQVWKLDRERRWMLETSLWKAAACQKIRRSYLWQYHPPLGKFRPAARWMTPTCRLKMPHSRRRA